MRSISRHITPLVIDSLGRGHTHTHTQARIPTIRTGSILRNQARAGLRPAHAWFNNHVHKFKNLFSQSDVKGKEIIIISLTNTTQNDSKNLLLQEVTDVVQVHYFKYILDYICSCM